MSRKQFLALFLCNLTPFIVGAGALPLLPVFAARLGAPPVLTGYYLALAYLAITAGTLVAGWLSGRFARRRSWLALAGVLGVPVTWAVGQATNLWALSVLTAGLWFLGGLGLTLTSILAGLSAGSGERGKVFGFLSMTAGLGSLIGGLITGPLVDRWGYPTMFAVLAAVMVLWVVAALLAEDRGDAARGGAARGAPPPVERAPLGKPFYLLFVASLTTAIAGFVSTLSRSLSMDALGFAATAISVAGAVGSAVAMPLPLFVGWLSDRVGRVRLMILCYLISAASIALLALSSSLWQFWLSAALGSLSGAASALGQALATDLIPQKSLSRGLSIYGTTGWIGAIIGFASTGHAVQRWGLVPTLIGSSALPLIAIVLLSPVRRAQGAALRARLGNP
jgi:MFS family permease